MTVAGGRATALGRPVPPRLPARDIIRRMPHAAIFLDRDNTLIANDGDLGDPAQVRVLPGAAQALGALRDAGYRIVVVSNQGGVARGAFSEADVDAVNQRTARLLDAEAGRAGLIDRFY